MITASPVHPRSSCRRNLALFAGASFLAACFVAPASVEAQQPDGGAPGPWPSVSAGIHFGYDQSANGEVLGAHVRIPVLRNGRVEVVPSANVTFLSRLREYGAHVDAVYVHGGNQGGPYLGGGLALRNSIFGLDPAEARTTETGFDFVVGLKSGNSGRLGTQIEFRWIFLPGIDYEPRIVTLGVSLPLWGRRAGA